MYSQSVIKEVRDNRAALHAQASAIDLMARDNKKENREKFDRIMGDIDSLGEDIKRMERANQVEAEQRSTGAPPNSDVGSPSGADDPATAKQAQERYHAAWANMMKYGTHSHVSTRGT